LEAEPCRFRSLILGSEGCAERIRGKLRKAKEFNCMIEIHMKDISTVKYQPQRLWKWAQIASEVAEKYI
jgi:hypothetical protein